jgi:hypothetical protein
MNVAHGILMRIFGPRKGILGRLGGIIMARTNQQCNAWVIDLLGIQLHDSVLEVGFGLGVGIGLLARSVSGDTLQALFHPTRWSSRPERGT